MSQTPPLRRQLTSNFDRVDSGNLNGNSASTVEEIPTEAMNLPNAPFVIRTGEATHIGGGHENQDKHFCSRVGPNNEHLIMGVLDGHGRDLGELAATVARDYLHQELRKKEVLEEVATSAKSLFTRLFHEAHLAVKEAFRQKISSSPDGWEVVESDSGYLTKRKTISTGHATPQVYECNLHGGTTATVVVILHGERVLVANVGDSTALFGGINAEGEVLFKELSAEHSPESETEFKRVKIDGAPDGTSLLDNDMKTLQFVYDVVERTSIQKPKFACPPIFTVNHSTGACEKTKNVGTYYKNVRSDWATLVTTPPTAKFQDALAFTRSLGDLHLHIYGVSHVPDVFEFPLSELHDQIAKDLTEKPFSVILLCTDGVWDNWLYHEILHHVLKHEVLDTDSSDIQSLTEAMMVENLKQATKNFGNQADNMTGILCLISSKDEDSSELPVTT